MPSLNLTHAEFRRTQTEALIAIEPKFWTVYQKWGVPEFSQKLFKTADQAPNTNNLTVNNPTDQPQDQGFIAILRILIGQQLSVTVAEKIWQGLVNAKLTDPQKLIQTSDETLRKQGLSWQKIRYIRALIAENIDFQQLDQLDDHSIIARLTQVTGIGQWSAQMYLLFALARPDILAVDDLAIRVSMMDLFNLSERPKPKELNTLSQVWSPYRSVASLLLWEHYKTVKQVAQFKTLG